jgi:cell division septal protein FtsQ
MRHEPTHPIRGNRHSSFHALRLARRVSNRVEKKPFVRRSRQSEVRERRTRILMLLTMAFGFELSAAALTSPLLAISRIVIRGAEQLPMEEAIATEQAVTLPAGTNLLRAPIGQMERQMKSLAWVDTAQVRWLSPHTLGVRFKPRDPVVVAQVGGQRYEVDATGVPIRVVRPALDRHLPVIEVERTIDVQFGTPTHDEALLSAINIYRDAPRQPMVHIAKIVVDRDGNICLNMIDGIQVQLGQPDDLATKMRYVQRVYELEPTVSTRLVAINLTYPKQPACTLKNNLQADPVISPDKAAAPARHASGGDVAL